jgi:hypothetical protein
MKYGNCGNNNCTEINLCPTCQADLEYDYDVKRIGQDEADDLPDRNYEENPLSQDEITWIKKCLKNPKKCRTFMELQKRLDESFKNDKSHTEVLSY